MLSTPCMNCILLKQIFLGTQDPFAEVTVGTVTRKTPTHKKGGTDPLWEITLNFDLKGDEKILAINVWNDNRIMNDKICSCQMSLFSILPFVNPASLVDVSKPISTTDVRTELEGMEDETKQIVENLMQQAKKQTVAKHEAIFFENWFPLTRDGKSAGEILLRLQFVPDFDAASPLLEDDLRETNRIKTLGVSGEESKETKVSTNTNAAISSSHKLVDGNENDKKRDKGGGRGGGGGEKLVNVEYWEDFKQVKKNSIAMLEDIRKGKILRHTPVQLTQKSFFRKKKERNRLFGASLVEGVHGGPYRVPQVCYDCIEYLRKEGKKVGIFRIPGNNEAIQKLKNQYENGIAGAIELNEPNDAAGLLKLYLRELSVPLIPFSLYSAFLDLEEKSVKEKILPYDKKLIKYK